jgi:diguanylate cyclase (GGDEF)-like protein
VQRFRAALLALGLLLMTAGVAAGVLAEKAREDLDHDLKLASASRATAVEDFAERARAVTLVASHSAAFTYFYRAGGTREQRIRGQSGDPNLMPSVQTALTDVGLLFSDSLAAAGFIDRSGAENAVVVRGDRVDPEDLSQDRSDAAFFDRAFALPYGKVYQSVPYRSNATGDWVISTATKVDVGPGVSPAVVHFDFTIESFRLALYRDQADVRVRVVDLLDGRVIIDSTKPQDIFRPLGNPSDHSLRWVRTSRDGQVRSDAGMRHVVQRARADRNIATMWAVVVSVPERTGAWAGPTSAGPLAMVVVGVLLLGLSVGGYAKHGRSMFRVARRDELTGLRNRLAAREAAEALLAKPRGLAVLLCDLDRFKHVNDSLGHHAGDHLLTVIAQRLAEVVREPDDLVARLGGDEFVVLAGGVHDHESISVLCERLTRAVTAPVKVDGLEVSVGVSIGIAIAPGDGADYGTLLQRADIAMYDAKARRSGWQIYNAGLAPSDRAELTMDADLRRAVGAGELVLHFQPSFSISTGAHTRTEALVRWRHPERGLLSPGHFIPMAETTGAIKLVTREVLRQSLDQVVNWRAAGQDVPVAVNVSAHDVTDPDFADHVTGALTARGLPGSSLAIELTETALLTDPKIAGQVLSRLAAAGVALAVDDFGAGYASLLYLRRYPVSVLKLDLSLVQGLTENATDAALVRWTVEMAHSLGVTCVAEGVEDAETLRALAELGCDEAQGYFLQVPVPADELVLTPSAGSAV